RHCNHWERKNEQLRVNILWFDNSYSENENDYPLIFFHHISYIPQNIVFRRRLQSYALIHLHKSGLTLCKSWLCQFLHLFFVRLHHGSLLFLHLSISPKRLLLTVYFCVSSLLFFFRKVNANNSH